VTDVPATSPGLLPPRPSRPGRRAVLAGGTCAALACLTGRAFPATSEESARGGTSGAGGIALGEGRSVLALDLSADVFHAVALFGPAASLRGVTVVGDAPGPRAVRSSSPIDEDGLLPRVLAFGPSAASTRVELVVDVVDPVTVEVASVDPREIAAPAPRALERGDARPRPLVAIPPPASIDDGYVLQTPGRYAFLRIDVALVLRESLRLTRKRFRGDPIALSDASQWNGQRPATDRGAPRHISHAGGRDVDIGLPASDGTQSLKQDRCRGVRLAEDRYGCAPATVRGLDTPRLAYLLGAMCDLAPGEVVKIFLDEVYRREVIAVAPSLVDKRWLKAEAAAALSEDGILVASPWHTDHVHVRFRGEDARPIFSR
jgi:hypothetical protein